MIFWILVVCVLVFIFFGVYFESFGAFLLAMVGAFAALLVAVAAPGLGIETRSTSQETHNLLAMQTRDGLEGRYYLTSGYSNGQPGFNYLREDGDSVVMRFADAYQATVITQDADEPPTVMITYYEVVNPLLVTWPAYSGWTAEFHVSEDAISNEINVTP